MLSERARPGALLLTGDDPVFLDLVSPVVSSHADQVVNAMRITTDPVSEPRDACALRSLGAREPVLRLVGRVAGRTSREERRSHDTDKCSPRRWTRVLWDDTAR